MNPVRDKSSRGDCRTLGRYIQQYKILLTHLILGQRLFTSVSYL